MIWRRDEAESHAQDEGQIPRPDEPRAGQEKAERKDRRNPEMADNGEVTIVGATAKLEGNVVSAGSLRIDGQVKGQINADGDVSLSPQSQVEADIRAQNVSIAGRFKGNIAVKGKAHLARGGRIDGNITSKTLVVEEGGVFHGQSIMDAGAPSGSSSQAGSQGGSAPKTKDEPDQVKV
jgi:cytoskeletal protein CcmA (bactofilin family)